MVGKAWFEGQAYEATRCVKLAMGIIDMSVVIVGQAPVNDPKK
jgi:hypothetical protein